MAATESTGEERLLTRVREHRRTIEALSRIGPEGLSSDRLMQHVVAQVSRVTGIERAKVLRYRPESGDLLVEAGVGWKPGVVGNATLAVDYRSPAGRAFQTCAPVAIKNLPASHEFRYPDLLRDHGIVSLLNVPVMINGQTWGVLEVDSVSPYQFDEWDIGFLTTVANVMGVCLALDNGRQTNFNAIAENSRKTAQSQTLIREMQHRIKNNLQIIISFLTMKMRELPSEMQGRLNDVVGRVQAVALAHDLLSITEQPNGVNFGDYLRSLCANIDPQHPDITIEVEVDSFNIPIDRAVPAGLVVNELVTNAIKYAFGNGRGTIVVRFATASNSSEARVSVQDNGKGMAIPPNKGLGLSLVEGFAHQIQGRVEYAKADPGSLIILYFPIVS
jgi:two-component sensor histidine kinase